MKASDIKDLPLPPGAVDAHAFTRASIAKDLCAAREYAGLTQAELAKKLKVSQPMVSGAESGRVRVSERYSWPLTPPRMRGGIR